MNRRDIVVGIIVLAIAGLFLSRSRKPEAPQLDTTLPKTEENIENSFKLEIPDDLEKAELLDVSGGISGGLATRKFENGLFTFAILVDLPEPPSGSFYEGWLVKDGKFVSVGQVFIAKGGYLLNFKSEVDYSDYDQVVVTLEKTKDSAPEGNILEGSF